MGKKIIPEPTIKRLSMYFGYLRQLYENGVTTTSSQELADYFGLNPAQVRRDIASFGQFGKRGSGYPVEDLTWQIAEALGIHKVRKAVVVGAGNLGVAMLAYQGFDVHGFQLVAAFDIDTSKVGQKIRGKNCYVLSDLPEFVAKNNIEIAILATPAESAQSVLNKIAKAKIKAVLNFTPVQLNIPEGVKLASIDLAAKLKTLSYFLAQQG
ncbi:MAG: redox-sensing transcriptional repressor Rex [Candidatus Margulisiibacteriota bacterium]